MKLILAFSLLMFSACAHKSDSVGGGSQASVEHVAGRAPQEAPALYAQAVDELELQKFDESLRDFDRFIQQTPTSRYSQAALLNSGRALEGLKRWSDAALRYRSVIASTARAPRLQAAALYRLSYVHEALGDDPQVVADLSDLQARGRDLPQEVAEGEMPARLAAAYARVGNFQKAQQYYQRAEVGLARLRQKSAVIPEWLPKTLYLMGESSRTKVSWQDFETVLRPLARGQVYLLESAELSQAPWSERASKDLAQIYDELTTTLEKAPMPTGDPLLAKRALQKLQWERAALLLESLTDLKARFLPEFKSKPEIASLLSALRQIDARLEALLSERPAGEELTVSALARRRARQMRTQSTSDSLERAFLRSGRAESAQGAVVAPPEPKKEDPNL